MGEEHLPSTCKWRPLRLCKEQPHPGEAWETMGRSQPIAQAEYSQPPEPQLGRVNLPGIPRLDLTWAPYKQARHPVSTWESQGHAHSPLPFLPPTQPHSSVLLKLSALT